VEKSVEVARKEGAGILAHGCTAMGNDQVRFDVSIRSLGDFEIQARAEVAIACRSEPPPGSVSAMAARTAPVAMRGSQCACCAGVPCATRSLDTTTCPPSAPARLIQPRASSSVSAA
ncbi:MAG: argininosuccinate synthase, partial [Gemmatimonadetes bacterium]|nr:argininosuccinate synthase [Gemmatimonadota bacterium]